MSLYLPYRYLDWLMVAVAIAAVYAVFGPLVRTFAGCLLYP